MNCPIESAAIKSHSFVDVHYRHDSIRISFTRKFSELNFLPEGLLCCIAQAELQQAEHEIVVQERDLA